MFAPFRLLVAVVVQEVACLVAIADLDAPHAAITEALKEESAHR
jgi:hypothetical protein